MSAKDGEPVATMVRISLRRVRHEVSDSGESGWVLCGEDWSGAADWMIMADLTDGKNRRIVHENYRDARVAAGYVLEMHGVSFRFPASVDEWSYDLRSEALSCKELATAA